MTDLQLYIKLSKLSSNQKTEVAEFIDFLISKSKNNDKSAKKRIAGKAKGLVKMKDNFDELIEGFNKYISQSV